MCKWRKIAKKEKKIEFLLRISFVYCCISAYLIASTFSLLYFDLILLQKWVGFRRFPPYKDRQQGNNWSFIHVLGEGKIKVKILNVFLFFNIVYVMYLSSLGNVGVLQYFVWHLSNSHRLSRIPPFKFITLLQVKTLFSMSLDTMAKTYKI